MPVAGFRFLALGLSFATHVLLARGLGPQEFGVYAFTIALLTIVQPIAGGGLGALSIRELASLQSKDKSNEIKQNLIQNFLFISLLISTCLGLMIAIAGRIFESEISSTLDMSLIVLPAFVLAETMSGVLVGQSKVKISQFLNEVFRPALFLASLLTLFALINTKFSANAALLLIALTSWIAVLAAVFFNPVKIGVSIHLRARRGPWLVILRRSFPFAMISAMQYFNTRVDILFIGNFMTTADVGVYQIATKIAGFVHMPASLVAILLAPRFSAAYVENSKGRLRHLYFLGQFLAVALGITICLVFVLVGSNMIFWIYGSNYIAAVPPLLLLSVAQVVFSTTAVTTMLLSMTAFEGKVMRALMVGVVGNVILNAILIPQYGTVGAASATSVMWLVTFFILGNSLYRSGVLSCEK